MNPNDTTPAGNDALGAAGKPDAAQAPTQPTAPPPPAFLQRGNEAAGADSARAGMGFPVAGARPPAITMPIGKVSGVDVQSAIDDMTGGVSPGAEAHALVQRAKQPSIIPKGLTFEGTANYPGDVTVKGKVIGKVAAAGPSTITLAEGGEVQGDLKAKTVAVHGVINGLVDATGGLASFGASAKCSGSIQYARVSIAEGADVEATMKKAL